jgi:uncharacterized protein YndB with AHSA1/START domain
MTPSIHRETVLPAPAADVWRALTDPAVLAEWFANEVELDPRPGGRGRFGWRDGSERRATVELVERERAFGFTWRDERGRVTRVRIALDGHEAGTRVSVTETAVEPRAAALLGEWSWGVQLLAALPRLRRLAIA